MNIPNISKNKKQKTIKSRISNDFNVKRSFRHVFLNILLDYFQCPVPNALLLGPPGRAHFVQHGRDLDGLPGLAPRAAAPELEDHGGGVDVALPAGGEDDLVINDPGPPNF